MASILIDALPISDRTSIKNDSGVAEGLAVRIQIDPAQIVPNETSYRIGVVKGAHPIYCQVGVLRPLAGGCHINRDMVSIVIDAVPIIGRLSVPTVKRQSWVPKGLAVRIQVDLGESRSRPALRDLRVLAQVHLSSGSSMSRSTGCQNKGHQARQGKGEGKCKKGKSNLFHGFSSFS
jgi:hypothetical protein